MKQENAFFYICFIVICLSWTSYIVGMNQETFSYPSDEKTLDDSSVSSPKPMIS